MKLCLVAVQIGDLSQNLRDPPTAEGTEQAAGRHAAASPPAAALTPRSETAATADSPQRSEKMCRLPVGRQILE